MLIRNREGRGGGAVRGGEDGGGMRCLRGGMGVRRVIEAALRRGGLPLHPAPADMPDARQARLRLPALEMAAASLLFTQVSVYLSASADTNCLASFPPTATRFHLSFFLSFFISFFLWFCLVDR